MPSNMRGCRRELAEGSASCCPALISVNSPEFANVDASTISRMESFRAEPVVATTVALEAVRKALRRAGVGGSR